MQRFKNILFCTDGRTTDHVALETAVDLATVNEACLTVFNVVEELPRELMRLAAAMPSESLQAIAMDEARQKMERLIASVPAGSGTIAAEVSCGRPSIEIIRAVLRKRHDLVIVAGSARKGIKNRLFGSTGMRLMRKCPCPVWVINSSEKKSLSRILAAVDPDPLDAVRDGMNTKIMELAVSLAETNAGALHVVHAWQPMDEASQWGWQKGISPSDLDGWTREISDSHRRSLENLLARFDLGRSAPQIHMVEGDASTVIPSIAAKEQIDLIVMGTVAHVGLEGYLIGNTAETVLNRVTCSVLTIKPEGFVCPVKLA